MRPHTTLMDTQGIMDPVDAWQSNDNITKGGTGARLGKAVIILTGLAALSATLLTVV